MAILAFQKPDKVVMLEATDKVGKFEFRPLEPGFGITIGNALRRILLSSLEGYAINTIRDCSFFVEGCASSAVHCYHAIRSKTSLMSQDPYLSLLYNRKSSR